jgi:putative copper export protein/methionine-rich copper-binding protein CopC
MNPHSRGARVRWLAAGAGLVVAIGLASPVMAHALLSSSQPSAGSNLSSAPTEVVLTFTEAPDPKLSSIDVLASSGKSVTSGPATAVAGSPTKLRVGLGALKPGIYTVAWTTVSSVDGHLARGSFAFGVGATPPSSTQVTQTLGSAPVSPVSVAGRWLLYGGLMVLLGAAFVGLVVFPTPPSPTLRLLTWGWVAAAAGSATVIGVQMVEAGVGLANLIGTSIALALAIRLLPLLVALAVIAWHRRRGGVARPALALVGIAAAAAMLADVVLSHAAASGAVIFNIFVQWIHVAASGMWLGGLVALLFGLRGRPGDETRRIATRFANTATVGIALVAATGVVRALSEIGSLENLAFTDFGRLLVAKSALLGLLAGLGAINHFRSVPRAGRSLGLLRRIGSMELMVATTVLLLTATLVNLAPPAQAASVVQPPPASVSVVGNDFGTTVRMHLTATPGTNGFNVFRALLTDYDTGEPLIGRTVALRFSLPARPDIGASQLQLKPAGDGVYQATGPNLSIDGAWRIAVQISGGTSSVEVALQLTTRQPQLKIDVNAVPGLPTIYTVHLAESRTVQVYIDPGKAGANEVHLTFFDRANKELPVPSAQLGIGLAGQALSQPVVRTLEPGHFVADATLSAGTYSVSFSATASDGQTLAAQLQIPVTK